MQSVDLANRTVNIHASKTNSAEQTGVSFMGRGQSVPAPDKKRKPNYEGMTKEQIKQAKKEKRQRRNWNKYKEKLAKERDEVTKTFHNNYYWNSFVNTGSPKTGQPSAKNTVSSAMYTQQDGGLDAAYSGRVSPNGTFVNEL